MSTLSADTSPEAERVQIELLRKASDARRIHMIMQLNASARELALIRLREKYPRESRKRLMRRLAGEMYGEELMTRATGPLGNDEEPHARTN